MKPSDHSSGLVEPEPRVLLTGDLECGMLEATGLDAVDRAHRATFEELGTAEHVSGSPSTDLVVVIQSRPGQWSTAQLQRLKAVAHRAPVVLLQGPWCEGQSRRDAPLPGAKNVAWHNWPAVWSLYRERYRQSGGLVDASPAWLLQIAPRFPSRRIVVDSPSRATWEMYAAGFEAIGWSPLWLENSAAEQRAGLAGLLVDGYGWNSLLAQRIVGVQRQCGGLPWVVALGFPRDGDVTAARQMGARAVVAKPFELATLAWCADRLLDAP